MYTMWYERISKWYENGWYEKTLVRKAQLPNVNINMDGLKVSKFGSKVSIKCMAPYWLSFFYLESLNNNLILPLLVYTLHFWVASSDEITRKLSNQACFAGCAESDVWFPFRTLQQNGGYVEYSCCSDIILRQVRMFSDQLINHFI